MRPAAVVIGRNEGARLIRCLASVREHCEPVIYVDSGSGDGSVDAARAAGAEVIELDMQVPFTAARARNAGIEHLFGQQSVPDYIQFLDGDCTLRAEWPETARRFLDNAPDVAVVCGRRREIRPEETVYNGLIDREWETPVGQAEACGGDAMIRSAALRAAGGYNPDLIAGEEPELCLRLRQAGWKIWRLDAEMTLHDADIRRFAQWWQRSRRAGHAYAEGAFLHGASPERHYVRQTRRALLWGAGIPLAAGLGTLLSPLAAVLLLAWPAQVLRLRVSGSRWAEAFFLTLGKIPETQGILGYYLGRLKGTGSRIIEYK